MKAYKIDLSMYPGKVREAVSEAVQKEAKSLELDKTMSVCAFNKPYLFVSECGGTGWDDDKKYFEGNRNIIITAADFLALESAKDEPTFKPFDKVLVRDGETKKWKIEIFSHMEDSGIYRYGCLTSQYEHCLPYEGNEHLLGTTDKE